MFRLFQRHYISASRPQGLFELEGSPGVGRTVGTPVSVQISLSLSHTHSLSLTHTHSKILSIKTGSVLIDRERLV